MMVTNADFMSTIFKLNEGERVWVNQATGNPHGSAFNWKGVSCQPDEVGDASAMNAYFSVASIKGIGGRWQRQAAGFSRMHCLVLDDTADCELAPTWKLETSPNNFQIGFKLNPPISDPDLARKIAEALGKEGRIPNDKSGNNLIRYVRLPVGLNGKSSPEFACRLVDWNPDIEYDVMELVDALGLDLHLMDFSQQLRGVKQHNPGHDFREALKEGHDVHQNVLRLIGSMVANGKTKAAVDAEIAKYLPAIAEKRGPERVEMLMGGELERMYQGAIEKGFDQPPPHVFGGDVANGKEFSEHWCKHVLFIAETDDVLAFETSGWIKASPGSADRMAKQTLLALRRREREERLRLGLDDRIVKALAKRAEAASKAQGIRNMIAMARSEPGMMVSASEFDADPMVLGVENGVIDLIGLKLLKPSPDILVSKRCNVMYNPKAKCPKFIDFLDRVQPDSTIRQFLQEWIGHCLTGKVDYQMFLFLYGHGANGKSVFIEIIAYLLGDYAHRIATEMLMSQKRSPQGPSPDILGLLGRRMVFCNETTEGRSMDEARVKEMTGGDTLSARAVYGKTEVSFRPTHKLIMVGNHKPDISDQSHGMWRRVALIPFEVTIPEGERNPKLLDELKKEAAGILNWAIQGLKDLDLYGLRVPQSITAATDAYKEEQDILGEWISDYCSVGPDLSATKGALYESYSEWINGNGHRPVSQKKLTRTLGERGFGLSTDRRRVLGIRVTSCSVSHALSDVDEDAEDRNPFA